VLSGAAGWACDAGQVKGRMTAAYFVYRGLEILGGGDVLREFNNNHGFPSSCSSPLGSGRCWLVRAVSVMMRGAWKVVGSPRPSFLLERAAGSLRQNCLSFLGGGSCERRSRVM
jgi:hypothetical protein